MLSAASHTSVQPVNIHKMCLTTSQLLILSSGAVYTDARGKITDIANGNVICASCMLLTQDKLIEDSLLLSAAVHKPWRRPGHHIITDQHLFIDTFVQTCWLAEIVQPVSVCLCLVLTELLVL